MTTEQGAESLGRKLGQQLGAAIIRGDYPCGERLPTEHELCDRQGLSRGAVREAIKVLASKGLVQSRRRQGTIVNRVHHWNLLDPDILDWMREVDYSHRLLHRLIQVRQAIEPEACAIVAERHQRVNFSAMSAAVEIMEEPLISEPALLAADTDFHLGILDATGNPFFQQFRPLVRTTLCFGYELIDLYHLFAPQRTVDAAEHRQLLGQMMDGNIVEARRASRAVMDKVRGALESLMDSER